MRLIIILLEICLGAYLTSYPNQPISLTTKIDSSNLAANYDYIRDAIINASFIAIDAEFGGTSSVFKFLGNVQPREDRYFDLLEDRYGSLKTSVENHPMLQLGISCYSNVGLTSTFSFMLLPAVDRMSVSLESMAFLARNGFDFSTLFLRGIRSVRHVAPVTSITPNKYGGTVYYNQPVQQQKEDETLEFKMTSIVNLILSLKKPIITHNGLLDLMHLMDKFVKPLPANLSDFKQFWHVIPIFDTKYMATSLLNQTDPKQTTLKILSNHFKLETSQAAYHDAGYDAFITSRIFLIFLQKHFYGVIDAILSSHLANKIFTTKSDFEFWNLRDLKQTVDRSKVFKFVPTLFTRALYHNIKDLIVICEEDPNHSNNLLIKVYDFSALDLLRKFGSLAPYSRPPLDQS